MIKTVQPLLPKKYFSLVVISINYDYEQKRKYVQSIITLLT